MNPEELSTQKMLTRMAEDIAAIKSTMEDDHRAVFGNGRPGLIERVTTLETKVAYISAIAGAVTGIVGGAIVELVKLLF